MKFVTQILVIRSFLSSAIGLSVLSFLLAGCADAPPPKQEPQKMDWTQKTNGPASPAEIADLVAQIGKARDFVVVPVDEKFKSIPKALLGRYKGPLTDDAIKAWTSEVETQIFKPWCSTNYKKEALSSINASELPTFYRLVDSPLPPDRFFQNYYAKMLEFAQKTGAPYIYMKNDYRDRYVECSSGKNHQDYKARLNVLDSALMDLSGTASAKKKESLAISLTGRKVEKQRTVYIMLQTEEQVHQSTLKLAPFTEKLDANANAIVQQKLAVQVKANQKMLLQSLNKNFSSLLKRNEKDGYFRRYIQNSATIEREIPASNPGMLAVTGEYKSQQSTEIGAKDAERTCTGNPSDGCAAPKKRIYKGANITTLIYDAYFSRNKDGGIALETLCNISGRDKGKNPSSSDERYCFDTKRLIR